VDLEDVKPCPTCQGTGHVAKGVTMLQPPEQVTAAAGGAPWMGDPSIRPQG